MEVYRYFVSYAANHSEKGFSMGMGIFDLDKKIMDMKDLDGIKEEIELKKRM